MAPAPGIFREPEPPKWSCFGSQNRIAIKSNSQAKFERNAVNDKKKPRPLSIEMSFENDTNSMQTFYQISRNY